MAQQVDALSVKAREPEVRSLTSYKNNLIWHRVWKKLVSRLGVHMLINKGTFIKIYECF